MCGTYRGHACALASDSMHLIEKPAISMCFNFIFLVLVKGSFQLVYNTLLLRFYSGFYDCKDFISHNAIPLHDACLLCIFKITKAYLYMEVRFTLYLRKRLKNITHLHVFYEIQIKVGIH